MIYWYFYPNRDTLFQDYLTNGKLKRTALIWKKFCNIINVFTLIFDQFNAWIIKKLNSNVKKKYFRVLYLSLLTASMTSNLSK